MMVLEEKVVRYGVVCEEEGIIFYDSIQIQIQLHCGMFHHLHKSTDGWVVDGLEEFILLFVKQKGFDLLNCCSFYIL